MKMSIYTGRTELPPIESDVSVRLLEGVIVTGVVTGHGQKDGKPTFDFEYDHRTPEGQILKASKWAWPEQVQRNLTKTVTIDLDALVTLVSCAQAHVEDIETGIEEGLYVQAENTDLPTKIAAVNAASKLMQTQQVPAVEVKDSEPLECPPGGYFIMYGYEKSADHRDTLTAARKRGQELCDEDLLPNSWSIHDAESNFVEDITRSDRKSLEDLIKAFGSNH